MKRLMIILLSIFLVGQVWAGNIVGITRVAVADHTPGGALLLGIQYVKLGSGTNNTFRTLDEVAGTGSNTSWIADNSYTGDQLYPLSSDTYWLQDNNGAMDPSFYYHWLQQDPDSGEGMFVTNRFVLGNVLQFKRSGTAGAIFLCGEIYPASSYSFILSPTNNLNWLCNPFPMLRTLDDLFNTNTVGITAGTYYTNSDTITFYTSNGVALVYSWFDSGHMKWCYTNGVTAAICAANRDYDVLPGLGFYYINTSNFTWTVTNPFTLH